MNRLIAVTQKNIDEALADDGRGNGSRCMVQRALVRMFPGQKVYASYQGHDGRKPFATIGDAKYKMTPAVGAKMCAFDDGKEVKPFKFRLIPDGGRQW